MTFNDFAQWAMLIIIIIACVVWVVRRFTHKNDNDNDCECGCDGCPIAKKCRDKTRH